MVIAELIIAAVIALIVLLTVVRSVRIIPQARARNVERFGRYRKTLEPGMNFIIPFVDRVKTQIDLREQVVSFNGQPVITEDNLVVLIDTVLFFQVTDPRAADYEIVNYIRAIEQLTATMLRSVIGSMDLEQTLTSRDKINTLLRGVLDDASGKWGIRVTRVEIKAIDPPKSVKDAMEKQMRAEREKRAAILTAEGAAAVEDPDRRGRQAERDPARRGRQAGRDPARRGPGRGDLPGLPGDPPQRPRPEAARLPVPADAAADRQRPGQHVLGDPERGDHGAEGGDLGLHRRAATDAGPRRQSPGGDPDGRRRKSRRPAGRRRRGTAASAQALALEAAAAPGTALGSEAAPQECQVPEPERRHRNRQHAARLAERQLRRRSRAPRRGHRAGRRQPTTSKILDDLAGPRPVTRPAAPTVPR